MSAHKSNKFPIFVNSLYPIFVIPPFFVIPSEAEGPPRHCAIPTGSLDYALRAPLGMTRGEWRSPSATLGTTKKGGRSSDIKRGLVCIQISMQNFCFNDIGQTLKALKTTPNGLSGAEAESRIKEYGLNELDKGKKAGVIKLFFSQFKDFMTALLIIAAAVSAVVAYVSKDKNDLTDTFIILSIIFMNAIVSTIQQYRADKAIENLKKLSAGTAKVVRDGNLTVVDSSRVTVGDVIEFEEGDVICADCRIMESHGLKCDESALTGESVSVEKNNATIRANKVALGEMSNTLFNSTFVVSGNARAVVTAVGMNTETGAIAAMLKESKEETTPLENTLNVLGKAISGFVLAITAIIFILGLFVRGEGVLKNFMTSVAVAVAAIPEGLPAVVTIIMAMGVQRMSKRNVVIRKLKSVETLGGCSVICSDKTGTLTENKLRVAEIFCADGAKGKLLQCMTACTSVKKSASGYVGDPTEIALMVYADGCAPVAACEKIEEIPFTSERKMMSVAAACGREKLIFSKGAPDVLVDRCSFILTPVGVRAMTGEDKRIIAERCNAMSDGALRTLGFAYRNFNGALAEDGLIFIGLCGMIDGLKEGVREAVAECRDAGIATVMITGDHVRTALALAKKAGICESEEQVMSGERLDGLSAKERDEAIVACRVFARVSPKHKNIIVGAFKRKGHVTAMTGDGINDAPSIKSADVGIAMGSGTDVTKNASDIVLADDNFTTLVAAVREGRRISANVRKTIQFFLSTNLAEVLAILIASLVFFRHSFMLSTQLLWLNLITDSFPVLALGMEKEDVDVMKTPPVRAEKSLFSKSSLSFISFFGLYITALTIGVYAVALSICGNAVATALAFICVSFAELFQAFNIRSERQSLFKCGLTTNKILLFTVIGGILVNVALALSPFKYAFGLDCLGLGHWLIAAGVAFTVIPVGEVYKLIARLISKRHPPRPRLPLKGRVAPIVIPSLPRDPVGRAERRGDSSASLTLRSE